MARSIWNGCLGVGDLRVPVKLYGAVEDQTVHFREVHAKDGARLEHRRVDTETGDVVEYRDIVRGFEVGAGEYVVLSDDELRNADGPNAKLVEIEAFVPAGQVDPVYFDKPYYLGPRTRSEDGYRLLHDALARAERVGIGRIVLRTREQLVALRALGEGVLGLSTMRFADEVVEPSSFDVPEPGRAPSRREVDMASALVEQLSGPFDPTDYEDEYRAAVLEVIARKAQGEEIDEPDEGPEEPPDDLAAALEATLSAVGRRRRTRGEHRGARRRPARRRRGEHRPARRSASRSRSTSRSGSRSSGRTRTRARAGSRSRARSRSGGRRR